MELELELGDDAEVPAAAAQPPVELGVLALARVDEPTVGGDDVGADEVVAREPVLPHQPADPAAEREAGHTGRRDEAAGRGEPVRLGLVVDVGPDGAAADGRLSHGRVHAHAVHGREVDHHAVVAGREARDAVAAAADGDRQVVAPCKADGCDHVGRAGAADDERRPVAVVGAVPDATGFLVARVGRGDHLPLNRFAQLLDRRLPQHPCNRLAHLVLLASWLDGESYRGRLRPPLAAP